jgi:hypothetical protein
MGRPENDIDFITPGHDHESMNPERSVEGIG